jgi:type I restriction enzyme S subunit
LPPKKDFAVKTASSIVRQSGKNAFCSSYYEKISGKIVCIDEQIPFDVPKSWEWYRLLSFWDLLSGRDLTPSEYTEEETGIPYITGASNFTDNSLIINRWTNSPKTIAQNGDLLVTCKGTVGTMLINTQGNIHIARQIMAVRNHTGLNVDFLRIVMTSFLLQITSAAKGIIPGISREDLLDMLIPCPPLQEQIRIVRFAENVAKRLREISESLI